jgi:cobalt-precorrin 5A hydrolase
MPREGKAYAIWALTPQGACLGQRMHQALLQADLFVSRAAEHHYQEARPFSRLKPILTEEFRHYRGHIFIMSTGIVVRLLAPLIADKLNDPAVLVVDESGQHVISLLAGHIGGANQLAQLVAGLIGGVPVITTATDVNELPAIDVLATKAQLTIENPQTIKTVHMAVLKSRPVQLYDPSGILTASMHPGDWQTFCQNMSLQILEDSAQLSETNAGIFIGDQIAALPPQVLVLRPPTLTAGIGCNRNTDVGEIDTLLQAVLETHRLSPHSLAHLASIDLKKDETGLLALSQMRGIPLLFYNKNQLKEIEHQCTPSSIVEKHVGVKSVCEAAAILAAQNGKLIVPKHSTRNVTVAIARKRYTSSVSAPAT